MVRLDELIVDNKVMLYFESWVVLRSSLNPPTHSKLESCYSWQEPEHPSLPVELSRGNAFKVTIHAFCILKFWLLLVFQTLIVKLPIVERFIYVDFYYHQVGISCSLNLSLLQSLHNPSFACCSHMRKSFILSTFSLWCLLLHPNCLWYDWSGLTGRSGSPEFDSDGRPTDWCVWSALPKLWLLSMIALLLTVETILCNISYGQFCCQSLPVLA